MLHVVFPLPPCDPSHIYAVFQHWLHLTVVSVRSFLIDTELRSVINICWVLIILHHPILPLILKCIKLLQPIDESLLFLSQIFVFGSNRAGPQIQNLPTSWSHFIKSQANFLYRLQGGRSPAAYLFSRMTPTHKSFWTLPNTRLSPSKWSGLYLNIPLYHWLGHLYFLSLSRFHQR